MLETLAASRMEKPPMVTQASIPGVRLRMASIWSEVRLTRGWEAPSGSRATTMA